MREATEIDRRDPDVVAMVTKMKVRARESPWVPFRGVPRDHYHHLHNGLSLCLTLDILAKEDVSEFFKIFGAKPSPELGEGGKFWHLSITQMVGPSPAPEEVEFWPQAFFEEAPIFEMPGMWLHPINTKHFFWRTRRQAETGIH